MSVRRKVQKIIDGDTFKVHRRIGGSQYIRIASIDAPEKGERGYMSAKRRLNRIRGETGLCTITPSCTKSHSSYL